MTMTREQQLTYCRACKHRDLDSQNEFVCGLTGHPPDFDPTCSNFFQDGFEFKERKIVVKPRLASHQKRFANFAIDFMVNMILLIAFGIASATAALAFFPDEANQLEADLDRYSVIIALIVRLFYYFVLESASGRTVGKLITRTRVVDKDGKTPSANAIFLRSLARYVPFEPFSFLGNDPRGWHDTWTDTYVIEVD